MGLTRRFCKGSILAAIGDRVPTELRGTAFGTIALATGIVLFPANFLAGILWENVSYQAPFFFGSILSVLAALLLLLEVKRI